MTGATIRKPPFSREGLVRALSSDFALVAYLALAKLLLHLVVNRVDFTLHPDFFAELGARHTDHGFSNETPLGPLIVAMSRITWWDASFTLRVFPAIMGAAVVLLVGLTARELGAGRFGQCLAALGALASAHGLTTSSKLHSSSFELLFWVASTYLVARILGRRERSPWVAVGLICGLGLLNKQSMALLPLGLAVGLALTPHRRELANPWLAVGALAGLAVFSPYLWWQHHHGWPVFEYVAEQRGTLWSQLSFPAWLLHQLGRMNPVNVFLWLPGLVFLLTSSRGRRFRPLGWIFIVTIISLAVIKGRVRSGLPAYYILLAAGAPLVEAWLAAHRPRLTRPILPVLLVTSSALMVPLATTVLTPSQIDAFGRFLGRPLLDNPSLVSTRLRLHASRCSDRYYERFAGEVIAAWEELPAGERDTASVFVPMLAEAAAVDAFGAERGLPKTLSSTDSSHRRGLRGLHGDVLLVAAPKTLMLGDLFARVDEVTTVESRLSLCNNFYLPEIGLFICRDFKTSREDVWNVLFLRAIGKEEPGRPVGR